MKIYLPAVIFGLFFATGVWAYEEPAYTVVFETDGVEYRRYEPYLVAETQVTTEERNRAANVGFRRLFDYISGANKSRTEIAMTAPVQQQQSGQKIAMTTPVRQEMSDGGWTVAFVVPDEFDRQTVPMPTNPDVYIREVPSALIAVLRFSGRWTDRNVDRHKDRLRTHLAVENVEMQGEIVNAFYNAPFVLPFMRRNEVMVEVDRVAGEGVAAAGP